MSRPTLAVSEAADQIVGGVFVVDVREHDEYAAGHIDRARLVPLGTLASRLDEVPRDQPVIVVCRSGNRSGMATDQLAELGIDAWNMAGGMTAWTAADLPTARD